MTRIGYGKSNLTLEAEVRGVTGAAPAGTNPDRDDVNQRAHLEPEGILKCCST